MKRLLSRQAAMMGIIARVLLGSALLAGSFPLPATSSTVSTPAAETTSAWTTYGGDTTRQANQMVGAPALPVRLRWTAHVNGQIYGEPLIYGGRVYLAT